MMAVLGERCSRSPMSLWEYAGVGYSEGAVGMSVALFAGLRRMVLGYEWMVTEKKGRDVGLANKSLRWTPKSRRRKLSYDPRNQKKII